jgi:uncharacterized protein (DUF305 family)
MFTTPKFITTKLPRAVLLGIAAGTAAALTGLAGCADNDMSGMDHGSSRSASAAPSSSAAAPSVSSTPAAGPHNDADVMFASMMIPHHNQAIEMSDILLAKDDTDSEVAALAQKIKTAQGPEVAQMTGWLVGWGEDPSTGGMQHGGDDGMMSQAEMDALRNATGDAATQLFLDGMIKHHTGAIAMAKTELEEGANPDAKKLAQAIIDSQEAEIAEMRRLGGT